MVGPQYKKRIARGMQALFVLMVGILLLEFLLIKSGDAVFAWTWLIALVIMGGFFFVIPWGLRGPERVNHWYRAADWAVTILCVLLGALFLGAAITWGIIGPIVGQVPAVTSVLLITAWLLCFVGLLPIGALRLIGWIAQGNEETRQWVRRLGQTNDEARARAIQEDNPPL